MDIDESSNFSDMSIDLVTEEPTIKNIDEGASLEESPEYADEIDIYHRKLEVGIWTILIIRYRHFIFNDSAW